MKIQNIIKIFTTVVFIFTLFTTPVFAQNLKDAFGKNSSDAGPVQPGASDTAFGAVVAGSGYDINTTFDSMIGKIILALLSFLGIIFLILLIYAGFLWMTASGNDQQITKARSMITSAIIGLIIVLSAYSISFFVLSALQGGSLDEGKFNTSSEPSAEM